MQVTADKFYQMLLCIASFQSLISVSLLPDPQTKVTIFEDFLLGHSIANPTVSILILVRIGYIGVAQQKHNTNHRYNSKFSKSHIKNLKTVEII